MPTIIDSLIVKLGLDKKDYDKGSAQVNKSLKETRSEADKTGSQFKKSGKDSSESFEKITKSAIKFFALLGSTMAVKDFIRQTVMSNAALYRLSKNLEEHVSTVSAWSNAAQIAGGSAQGMQSTMQMLSRAQTEMQITGQSALIPYFSALGVAIADSSGHARSSAAMLLDLSDRFSHMDRKTAFNMGQMMGIDPGTLNLLLKGRAAVQDMIRTQERYGAVTKQQAHQAELFRQQVELLKLKFLAFGRQLLSDGMPVLEKLFDVLSRGVSWMVQHKAFVEAFLTTMSTGLFAIAIAALPLSGTILLILALGTAIGLLWDDYQVWKKGGKSFINWGRWNTEISNAKKSILGLAEIIRMTTQEIGYYAQAWSLLKAGKYSQAWKAAKKAQAIDNQVFGLITGIEGPSQAAVGLSDKAKKILGVSRGGPSTVPGWVRRKAQALGRLGGGVPVARDQAMYYFMKQGWTKDQAAGIVANLQTESSLNPDAQGDKDKNGVYHAYGLGQWHKDRQSQFEKVFGKPIQQATYEDQLAFVQWELTHTERDAGNALKNATSAQQAGAIVSSRYERPADKLGNEASRGALSSRIAGASQYASGALAASSHIAKAASNKTVNNYVGHVTVHTQATDAKGISQDMARSLDSAFTAQANYGLT